MSTIEDFENAPLGATATNPNGCRAMKAGIDEHHWVLPSGSYVDDESMVQWGYTLDPLDPSAPTTAREALDLAWELAHPVKEGQVIPVGAWLVDRRYNKTLVEKNTSFDIDVDEWGAENIRTLEPLPDPEPEWRDALVVLARHVNQEPDSPPSLWANLGSGMWGNVETTKRATVWDLRDVTPLYPKGQDA